MYAISKLSKESQSLINYLTSGVRSRSLAVSLTIGKVLSETLNLPTAPVENPEQFFKDTILSEVQSKIEVLNELAVIDFETAIDYTKRFWIVRYYAAYPKKYIYCPCKDSAIEDFLNASLALDSLAAQTIRENSMEITKLHKEIHKFFNDVQS